MGASRSLAEDATAAVEGPPASAVNRGASANEPVTLGGSTGRYIVIDEISRRDSGVMFRAYDPRLQREIALKTVATGSAEAQATLLQQAQLIAGLSHPNIVAVYDVATVGEAVQIAMEHVRGSTLATHLSQKLRWREVVRLFISAGQGLAAAHDAGVVHRGFKSTSVLLGDDGRVRVADFGLAHGASSGDPFAANADLPAADQHAFCVALWQALTGRDPFGSAGESASSRPVWPRNVFVPTALRNALVRGLAAEPSERWSSMHVLLHILAGTLHGRRAWRFTAGVVSVLGVSALAWGAYRQHVALRCTGAAAHLTGVWDDRVRQAVQEAIIATDSVAADGAASRVRSQLDAHASRWVAMHTQTCEATAIRNEQSAEALDLRMACLHRANVDLRAVTDLLSRADAQVVEHADALVLSLRGLERCADIQALRAEVPPPTPIERDAVESVRVQLAEVKALREAGKYPETLARMEPLAEAAEKIPYVPLRAEVLAELGLALENAGTFTRAEAAYKAALRSALACKQWEPAAFAAGQLVHVAGWLWTRPQEGLAYAETTRALFPHIHDPQLEADLHSMLGGVYKRLGRYAEAEAEHRAAIALVERALGPDHLSIAAFRGNLASVLVDQGRLAEAEVEQRAQVALAERNLEPDHPKVASAHYALGHALYQQGRATEAEAEYRFAISAQAKVLGPEHVRVAMARGQLGNALASQGRHVEAEVEHAAAVRILRKIDAPQASIAVALTNLGSTLAALGRHAEGETHVREALAIQRRIQGPNHPRVAQTRGMLVQVLLEQKQYLQAEAEARVAVVEFERAFASNPVSIAVATESLGRALVGLRRFEDAAAVFAKAVRLARPPGQREHAHAAMIQGRLGDTLRLLRRYEDAEAEYRDALRRIDTIPNRSEWHHSQLRRGLGFVLLERGQPHRARELLESVWTSWKDDAGISASVRAELASDLARALRESGRERGRARDLARLASELMADSVSSHAP